MQIPNQDEGGNRRRHSMPQITDFDAFTKDLSDNKIDMSEPINADTSKFFPTQSNFNQEKVNAMIEKGDYTKRPIICSHDNEICDGHHRWLAAHNDPKSGGKIPARFIGMDIEPLLDFLKNKPYVENKGIHESFIKHEVTLKNKESGETKKVTFLKPEVETDKRFKSALQKVFKNHTVTDIKKLEESMTAAQLAKREKVVKAIKNGNEAELQRKYGDDWKSVVYATATKQVLSESTADVEEFLQKADSEIENHRRKMAYQNTVLDEEKKEAKSKKQVFGKDKVEVNVEPTMDDTFTSKAVTEEALPFADISHHHTRRSL